MVTMKSFGLKKIVYKNFEIKTQFQWQIWINNRIVVKRLFSILEYTWKMFNRKSIIVALFVVCLIAESISSNPSKGKRKTDESSNSDISIYEIFSERDVKGTKKVQYRIQDVPESKFDDAVQLMGEYYNKLEPMNALLGTYILY